MRGPQIFSPEYYERMRELETHGWWNAAMRDVAALALAASSLPARGTLLDIGCGSGQTMSWFRRLYPEWNAIGVDIAWNGLMAARDGRHGVVCDASALQLPFAERSVQVIITLDVLQHLPLDGGDLRALREMCRVIVPGGLLFIRTNAQTVPATPDDEAHMFRRYSPADLQRSLVAAGFLVERLGRVNALLGLAEIARDLRARRESQTPYTGLLARASSKTAVLDRWKRMWLRTEGRLMMRGIPLPLGRSLLAVCRRPGVERS